MKEQMLQHKGTADATAGAHLSRRKFIAVSAESNVFQIFDAETSGRCLQEIPISDVTDMEDDGSQADLGASAKVADLTFWISSHSRDEAGDLRLDQHRLLAARIKKGKRVRIKQVGTSYKGLAQDLLEFHPFREWTDERLELAELPELVKSDRALNIQGLVMFDESLALGFRSPLVADKALVLPLHNPLEMVVIGSHAKFGEPLLLDLGGRGISSIDYWPQRDCYLICANDPTDDERPAYFLWTGKKDSRPRELKLPEQSRDLNPEGVVFFSRRRLLILSDDRSGQKKRPSRKKKFRSLLLKVS